MDSRAVTRGRWPGVVAAAGTVVVVAAFVTMLARGRSVEVLYGLYLFQNGPSAVVLLWMSRLVLRRRPGHGAGLVLLDIGVVQTLHVAVAVLADVRLVAAGFVAPLTLAEVAGLVPSDLPLDAAVPLWLMGWLWVPAAVLAVTMLPLLFPDGTLPHRWRPVAATATTGAVLLMVAFGIDGWPTADRTTDDTPTVVHVLSAAGGLAVLAAASIGMAGLVGRSRHADAIRRRQFRTVGVPLGIFAMVAIFTYPWQQVWIPAILVAFNALIVAYALAVARYRLHDVEPVLGRAAVVAALSVLVAAVYLTVVVGVGSLVGAGAGNPILTLAAVAAVALLVEPARRWTLGLVDRLLYHRYADRSEVLSRLTARANVSATAADVLGEVIELMLRSTGAARAEAWLDTDPSRPAAAAGASDESEPILRAAVTNQGERFGELRLYARAAADLAPDAAALLDDVARVLGMTVRNDRLTHELRARLDELKASRQRLVEAHDRARRGLERDIHDGAQTRLIALRLRLGALRARTDAGRDRTLIGELDLLAEHVDAAVRSLRQLARGLHPPILEQSGLVAALQAGTRGLPVPVSLTAHGMGRYPRAVETAAYFCCLEAVQNAARHSGATHIAVELTGDAATVRFCIHDNGVGFDPDRTPTGAGLANIGDRVAALGGHAEIDSAAGGGTRISGRIPAQPLIADR